MKIGLLTMHHSHNYGAMLQAYATFNVLRGCGHDVEFIDYDWKTTADGRKIFLPNNSVSNMLRNVRNLFQYRKKQRRIAKFERFYQKLAVGSTCYRRADGWDVTSYDVVVTGSDQTFSLYLSRNPQEMRAFFLGHVDGVRKVSYASSMGEKFSQLKPEDITWMKERFESFDYLSVREAKSADFIEQLTGKRPRVVLDPTLMLSQAEWAEECVPSSAEKGDYIVFYTVLSGAWVVESVKKLAAQTGLKVIALHPPTRYEFHTRFHYKMDIGPAEFISLIRNATYVVTTSFHATCFSILFQKKFISMVLGEGNRLKALLSTLGLQSQLVDGPQEDLVRRLERNLDYDEVTPLLQKEVEASMDYLKEALKP